LRGLRQRNRLTPVRVTSEQPCQEAGKTITECCHPVSALNSHHSILQPLIAVYDYDLARALLRNRIYRKNHWRAL
jgi:hypothetical protein